MQDLFFHSLKTVQLKATLRTPTKGSLVPGTEEIWKEEHQAWQGMQTSSSPSPLAILLESFIQNIAPQQKIELPFLHIPHMGAPVDLPAQFQECGHTTTLSPRPVASLLAWEAQGNHLSFYGGKQHFSSSWGVGWRSLRWVQRIHISVPVAHCSLRISTPVLGHKSCTLFQKPDLQLSKAAKRCTCLCALLLGCGHPGTCSSLTLTPPAISEGSHGRLCVFPDCSEECRESPELVEKLPLHKIGLHPCGDPGPWRPPLAGNFFRYCTCLFSLIKTFIKQQEGVYSRGLLQWGFVVERRDWTQFQIQEKGGNIWEVLQQPNTLLFFFMVVNC